VFYRTPIRRVHACPRPLRSLEGYAHRIGGRRHCSRRCRRRHRHRHHRYTDAAVNGSVIISRATRQREPIIDVTVAFTAVAATVVSRTPITSFLPIQFSLFKRNNIQIPFHIIYCFCSAKQFFSHSRTLVVVSFSSAIPL